MKKTDMILHPLGCSGIVCYVGDSISFETNDLVHKLASLLNKKMGHKFTGMVPSYHSVTIYYDSLAFSYYELKEEIEAYIHNLQEIQQKKMRTIYEVPVCYEGPFSPDIQHVADYNSITINDVISLHHENIYRIYMIGFLPGFPYLGGLNPKLATPRLNKPKMVPRGAVGIAGEQTGIYPFDSPGGWNIIGQTPILMFSTKKDRNIVFQSGDFIRFKAISSDEFLTVENSIKEDRYSIKKEVLFFE